MDHWTQDDNDGDDTNNNEYGEDFGDSGDGVNYTWRGGPFKTGTNPDGTPQIESQASGAGAIFLPSEPGKYTLTCTIDDTPTLVESPETSADHRDDTEVVRTVKVIVTKVKILWEGSDVTDQTQNVFVGKRIRLTAELAELNLSEATSSIWSVPGTIVNRWDVLLTAPYDLGLASYIHSWDLQNTPNINFCWVSGDGSPAPGIVPDEVTFTVTINGKTFSGKTTFNVNRPSPAMTASAKGRAAIQIVRTGVDKALLSYGTNVNPNHGIDFTLPSSAGGNYELVQLLTGLQRTIVDNQGVSHSLEPTYGLDTAYPYNQNGLTSDSPGAELLDEDSEVIINDPFLMTLMYRPGDTDASDPYQDRSVWVPRSATTWGWSAHATRSGAAWAPSDLVSASTTPPSVLDTNTYPIWTWNMKQSDYNPRF